MRFRILELLFRKSRPIAPQVSALLRASAGRAPPPLFTPSRALAQVHPEHSISPSVDIAPSNQCNQEPQFDSSKSDAPRPDERTLKLGKTLRLLQPRLPNLLASPLPQEILSPHISLHLFPSTHPHLPTVSGRVAYHAALWTSPITWGRVPLVGNVNLEIQSERMVKNGAPATPLSADRSSTYVKGSNEKLIVRWRTCGKTKGLGTGPHFRGVGAKETVDKITMWLGGAEKRDDEEFCGLFIFEFDEEGRIMNHVIERAEGGEGWDSGPGKWVGLTDWLLGRFGKGPNEQSPGLALGYARLGRDRAKSDDAPARGAKRHWPSNRVCQ